jgi:hypothetical protein
MINNKYGEMIMTGEKLKYILGAKPVPVPFCPPQISDLLA